MKKTSLALFVLQIILFGCTKEAPPIQNAIVARVGSDALSAKDFAGLMMSRAKYLDAVVVKDPATVSRIKADILREFVVHSYLRMWAKERNISPTELEVTAEVERMEKNYPNNNAFQTALSREGLTYDRWKEKIGVSIIEKKLFQELRSSYSAPTESEDPAVPVESVGTVASSFRSGSCANPSFCCDPAL